MDKGGKAGKWKGLLIVKFFFGVFFFGVFSILGVFCVELINVFD